MMSLISSLKPQLSPSNSLPRFNEHQERLLEDLFLRDKNPKGLDLELLAAESQLGIFDIKVWFEDRLARWRQTQGLSANMRKVSDFGRE